MRLTKASIYAIYGLACLAKQPRGKLVPMPVIVRGTGLPSKHLAKIFRMLVRAGMLRAIPGPNGGYALAKHPKKISVLDVLDLTEGPFTRESCVLRQWPCARVASCAVGSKLLDVEARMLRAYGRLSISTIAQESRPFGGSPDLGRRAPRR